MVTLTEVQSTAERAKPSITEYLNCGYINREIADVLRSDLDIEADVVIGGLWQSRSKREEHAFVRIPAQDVEDAPRAVIVDGAIKQFCESNRDDLWVVLGPQEELPSVAVLTGHDGNDWYGMYRDQQP